MTCMGLNYPIYFTDRLLTPPVDFVFEQVIHIRRARYRATCLQSYSVARLETEHQSGFLVVIKAIKCTQLVRVYFPESHTE